MLIVLLSWLVIFFEWIIIGDVLILGIQKLLGCNISRSSLNRILVGYMAVGIYAQLFSAVDSLGRNANILLGIICILLLPIFLKKNSLSADVQKIKEYVSTYKLLFFMQGALFLFVLSLTATPVVYAYSGDMGFYHSQFVHWLESYGTVPGLVNFTMRFATTGSGFYVSALYSWEWLLGNPLRAILPFLWLAVLETYLKDIFLYKEKEKVSMWMKVMVFVVFVFAFLEIDTYSSVHYSTIVSYVVFIKLAELIENKEKDINQYALLSVMALYNMTVKLSVVPLALLVVYPLVQLLKEKRIVQILKYGALCLFVLGPYFISNILVSGYLLFPQTLIDWFDFEWKYPIESVKAAADMTKSVYPLVYTGMASYPEEGIAITKWFPAMLKYLFNDWRPMSANVIHILYGVGIVVTLFYMILRVVVFLSGVAKKQKLYSFKKQDGLFGFILIGGLYVFLMSPGPQFMMWFLPMLLTVSAYGIAFIILETKKKFIFELFKITLALFFVCVIGVGGVKFLATYCKHDFEKYLVHPGYYYSSANFEVRGMCYTEREIEYDYIGDYKVYYPVEDAMVWYEPFPAVPKKSYLSNNYGVVSELRGKTINEGFIGKKVEK